MKLRERVQAIFPKAIVEEGKYPQHVHVALQIDMDVVEGGFVELSDKQLYDWLMLAAKTAICELGVNPGGGE
jgi:hypothetical protein